MTEEVSFKSMKITLSEEALDRVGKIMQYAAFRSYSSTIEECIRAVWDIMDEIFILAGERGEPEVHTTVEQGTESLNRIVMRMNRFTGRSPTRKKPK